jgi:hypothetical protein
MDSRPFRHDSIPDPSGLSVVVSLHTRSTLSYNCSLCFKDYPVGDGNAATIRNNFIKHAKSNNHLCQLILTNSDSMSRNITSTSETADVTSLRDDSLMSYSPSTDVDFFPNVESQDDSVPLPSNTPPIINYVLIHRTLRDLFGENSSNYLYYYHESLRKNSGFKAIMAKCLLSTYALHSSVSDFDVSLHFNLLKVLTSLSQRQRRSLAEVFSGVVYSNDHTRYNPSTDSESNAKITEDSTTSYIKIDLPISHQDFRRNYTHGSNSLWCNLPHPDVFPFFSRNKYCHCYTKVKDCIAHFLASGGLILPPESICNEAVNKAQQISSLEDNVIPIFIKLWSDGFEINNVKQNRGRGAWSSTFTIFGTSNHIPPEDVSATFTLGICSSSDSKSQDVIYKRTIDEINSLYCNSTSFYYAHDSSVIKGRVIILLTTQDQPERRKRNFLLLGNSKPSSRWGYVIPNIEEINAKLPSCTSCIENMKNNIWHYETSVCSDCFNWDSSLSNKKQKLSHKYLLDTVDDIHTQLSTQQLSLSQVKALSTSTGLNENAGVLIYDHHDKYNRILHIQNNIQPSMSILQNRLLSTMVGPEFELWSGSPLWKSLSHDIHDNVDAPMHLLFLGIMKSTMGYISDFFKVTLLDRSFTKVVSHKLKTLISIYKLSWLNILPFKNNGSMLDTSGWVGENFLAFSRLFLWYISPISLLQIEQPTNDPTDDDDDIHNWSKIKLKRFAEKNKIKVIVTNERSKHPTKLDYRVAIIDHKASINTTTDDEISTTDPFLCTVQDVVLLVSYLQRLIYSLMNKCNDPVRDIRNRIEINSRLYLFQLYKVTSYLSIKDVHLRLWNCQSLLNLGLMFERFGHLDNFWEGGIPGEGIIKFYKRERSCMSLEKWSYHMLLSSYRRRSLELCRPLTVPIMVHRKKHYHVYQSRHHFTEMVAKHLPLSILVDRLAKATFTLYKDEEQKLKKVNVTLIEKKIDIFDSWFELQIDVSNETFTSLSTFDDCIPIVLLPSLHLPGNLFCSISYTWT